MENSKRSKDLSQNVISLVLDYEEAIIGKFKKILGHETKLCEKICDRILS
jgi:hypothetical protein